MRQPEKFVCISYPLIDFLIPNEYVVSAVGVKDLNISLLHDQSSGIFDFDEIASVFTQIPRESEIQTMVVLHDDNNAQMSIVTTQECRVCTIRLNEFSLFSDYYSEQFKKFGLLACSFEDERVKFLIDVRKTINYMNSCFLEEL
ncbi:MAG: hypothetical protein PUC37_11805 [Spirochaetales bacterium]|nr:hypothetical protein [Spirochaetales bacterium]